jgi:hydantoinase/carbamoylase family amidase
MPSPVRLVEPARVGADPLRLQTDIDAFAALSEPGSGPGVTRLAYTPLERRAHELFANRMRGLGLSVRTDAAGNTIAEHSDPDSALPAIGTGSHLDSVAAAGRFDGIAGVVAALEMARLVVEFDMRHAHPFRFVAFAGEEGARFGQACIGSRIAAGLMTAEQLATKKDATGVTIADAMRAVDLDPMDIGAARWRSDAWAAFIELHIEQGGILESQDVPIGVVDVISGSTRLLLRTKGTASHTGGTPMHLRADAAAAAAEIVLLVESLANDPRHRGTRATVGRLDVRPGSITTIAGEADLYIDVRDLDNARQRATAVEVILQAQSVCRRRNVACEVELLADASPVVLPHWLRDVVAETCSSLDVAYRVLPSGASHDAQMVNHLVPSAMVFVPSRAGLSHTPAEWTDATQLATGVNVLVESMFRLDGVLSERTPR